MTHTRETIAQLLRTNDTAVARALVALNERQTVDEQQAERTKYQNGRGFMSCHAKRGTSMALWFLRTGFLTPRQIAYWRAPVGSSRRPRIEAYASQLAEIANARARQKLAA